LLNNSQFCDVKYDAILPKAEADDFPCLSPMVWGTSPPNRFEKVPHIPLKKEGLYGSLHTETFRGQIIGQQQRRCTC